MPMIREMNSQRRTEVDFQKVLRFWSDWKRKPRKPLIEVSRLVGILFFLTPLLSVIFGAEMIIGAESEVTPTRRLIGVLLVILGLPFLYLDWIYLRRPVKRERQT
jgi:protein-S-isoprenylcysteine O-methyltransferase Ste14